MRNTEAQEIVTDRIIAEDPEKIVTGLTDNEMAVIVAAGEYDAAYTANEARQLANGILSAFHQRGWGENREPIAEYIHDLADVVDGDKVAEDVKEKWENNDTELTP